MGKILIPKETPDWKQILSDTEGARDTAVSAKNTAVAARDDAEEAATDIGALGGIDGTVQTTSDLPSSTGSGDYYYVVDQAAYYKDTGSGSVQGGWTQSGPDLASLDKAQVFTKQQQFDSGLDTRGDVVDDQGKVLYNYTDQESQVNASFLGKPFYDITHPNFGVVGDGTNERDAYQAAIDAAANDGGGVVYHPPNLSVRLNPNLDMKSGVSIVGAGPSSEIFATKNATLIEAQGINDPVVANIKITGTNDSADTAQSGIRYQNVDRGRIYNVWLYDHGRDALQLTESTRCIVDRAFAKNGGDDHFNIGPQVTTEECILQNFISDNAANAGVHLSNDSQKCKVKGGYIIGPGDVGIDCIGQGSHEVSELYILAPGNDGIRPESRNNRFSQCRIFNAGRRSVSINSSSADNNKFHNVFSESATDHGFAVGDGTGNRFTRCAATGGAKKGFREVGGTDTVVLDCDFAANGVDASGSTGFRIERTDGYTTRNSGVVTITAGNKFVDFNHGLDEAPDPEDINVAPLGANEGPSGNSFVSSSATSFQVDNVDDTGFSIVLDVDPGSDVDFAWRANTE